MANNIGLKQQILRPTAAPRDTFVQPHAGAGLEQLANSLSKIAPALSRYGSVVAAEQGEKDKIEGENAARDFVEAHKTYKEAIDAGLIEKKHSPFYRMGVYETFGRASAYRFQEDFRTALAESPVAESTTPDDFDKFEGEFRGKWAKEHLGDKVDPFMQSAFGKTADNLINGDRSQFSQSASQRLEGQLSESFQAEVFSIAKGGFEGHTKPEDVLAQIHLAMDRQIAGHMAKRIVNENVAGAIVSAAKRLNDTSVLDLMDKISVGSGPMSGVSRFAALREQAENQIASVKQANLVHEAATAERNKKVAVEAVTADFVTALQKDPTISAEPFIARAVAAGDADKATTFLGMQKAYVDREYMDVPEVKQRLTIGVHTGSTSFAHLDQALAAKSITFQTYQSLADDIRQRDKAGTDHSSAKSAELERVRSRVRGLFVAEYGASTQVQRVQAEAASSEAVFHYLEWLKSDEGKGATQDRKEQWVHEEASRQFGGKADDMTKQFVNSQNIPDANFGGPKPVNPKKAPAIERPLYQQLREDLGKMQAGQAPSASSIRAMKLLNIPANPEAWQKFLDAQAQFMGGNP